MLNRIIQFSVRNKLIVALFVLALVGIGIYQATRLPIDAVPDITNNQVQIITVAPAFGATDIERLITFPIEQATNNIAGMQEMRSFSRFGLSLVTIVFDDATDIYWARQQVAERLQQVQSQIPAGVGLPAMGPITTGLGEIYQYVVKPKKGYEAKYDATQLRTIQDWIVRRQLLGVPGVAEVSSFGGKLKQYEVAVNPGKLNAYGITINDVFTALQSNNQNTGGGYIEKGGTALFIRSEGLIGNATDIGNISISNKHNSTPVFIRDIATVQTGFATRYGAICYNDEGEVSGAVVMMLKGANSSAVIRQVKERIAHIQETLPEGVVIEPFLDRTKMVNNAIHTVEKNLLEGALIVVFVLVLFLGNFRAGLIVASVIPLSMLFAICLMNGFGVSGNLMSLGALDFGLIVDGAVIIVEAVMHQLHHNKKFRHVTAFNQSQMDEAVVGAAGRMMNSAVFGQIIILIVYLPIFTLQGIEGKMFKPMAQTVAFALVGAFLLSVTYIPMMSAVFLSKKIRHDKNFSDRLLERISTLYQRLLLKVIRYPKWVLAAVALLLVAAVTTLANLGGEFIPQLEEGDFAVETRVLTGSNLNTTIHSTQQAAGIIKKRFPEVLKVVTKIGSGEVPTDPMPMDAADLMIILKDKSQWTSAQSFDELADKMSTALKDVPGITVGFQYPVQMRFNELMTGARQDVVCKIFGENLDTLAAYANRLGKLVNTVKGATALYVEPVTGMPQITIEYNRPLLAQYHLSVADINNVVNTAFAGQATGLVFEEEKRFDLVVRLSSTQRTGLDDVQRLLIPAPGGNQLPLSQLATVRIKDGPNQIQREDARRRIVVGFNVEGRDVQSIVEELQQKVAGNIRFPPGYYVTYGGAFENLVKAKQRLLIAVPVSLLLIFVLLFFAFNSVKHGLLIYTAIPLSAIGGIFFLALRGMPFSISAGVGFIALFGVAVLNGIVLIAEFNRLKQNGMKNLALIVTTGTRLRLRPVLMTAFVASLGFLPMALSNGAGAEVQRPLATVVIGGLMVATLLTLFVLPILYLLVEKRWMKSAGSKPMVSMLLLLLASSVGHAQQSISLEAAIQQAIQNNHEVKNEALKADYAKAMIGTAAELPATSISAEYGQINSIYGDTRFGIAQSVPLPGVRQRQKQLLNTEWQQTLLQKDVKVYELTKAVTQVFYHSLYLQQKQQYLRQADTLYQRFFDKASLRLQKGESNVLEKSTAQTQLTNIAIQLRQTQQELSITGLQLQLLLNSAEALQPVANEYKINYTALADTNQLKALPALQALQQQQAITTASIAVAQSKLWPELSAGYFTNSFIGTGADNKQYSAANRFNSVQIGAAIPLFTRGQKARLQALKVQESLRQNEYTTALTSLRFQQQQLLETYKARQEIVQNFESAQLSNASTILQTANKQFVNGEINYLDFVLLTNQAIAIQLDYVEAVRQLNESIIHLQYLTTK